MTPDQERIESIRRLLNDRAFGSASSLEMRFLLNQLDALTLEREMIANEMGVPPTFDLVDHLRLLLCTRDAFIDQIAARDATIQQLKAARPTLAEAPESEINRIKP